VDRRSIPYGRQWIDDDDIQAVVDVLRSDWVTQGEMVGRFEEALAQYCEARYAVVVSSGTAGLHLACLASGIGPGQTVLTSPITFAASANCALYCGGRADFVDIDPRTYNMDPDELRRVLAEDEAGSVKAVVPVHFAGQPCDMEAIADAARPRNLTVIEDACHALGGKWTDRQGREQRIGSCTHADMVVCSFHPVKIMTTGEGGAVLTNDKALYERLCSLRNHGTTKDPQKLLVNHGPWYYEMQELGYNYRITDFQCALGMNQLAKVDEWVERRRQIARRYDEAFVDMDETVIPYQATGTRSAYHLYVVQVVDRLASGRRKRVFEYLRAQGLGVQVHYIPVHLQPYYQGNWGYSAGDFPVAESYYEQCFSLPIFPKMTDDDVERVIATYEQALRACPPS
jgi:perosamine synthetase